MCVTNKLLFFCNPSVTEVDPSVNPKLLGDQSVKLPYTMQEKLPRQKFLQMISIYTDLYKKLQNEICLFFVLKNIPFGI